MFGKKSEMDYQFNPDPVDKNTAFENLKFIDEDKNGLGALNAGYCHSFAPFTLFMSSPTFIRTIRLFKKEQLQLHNELQAFVQDKNQWYNYSYNQYPTLRTLLQKVYGSNGWEYNNMAWNGVVYVLYFIAKICACTDENGKIIEDKGRSDKYSQGSFVDVNAKRLYEAIIEFRDSHKMKYSSEFEIFLSFLTHCSFIMGNGKLSSVPLQNGIILDIKSGETLEQNKDWKNHKDSFLKALSEAGDRAIVSAGGNHIFVFYRGNDDRYHAIGSLGNKTYGSIEDAIKAWATLTGTIMITTQKPQKELYESHVNGQLNAHLAVKDITDTLAYLCKKPYYDNNNIPYTYINYGGKIGDYVSEYTLKKWGLKAYKLDRADRLPQIRSLVFENIDKIANGIPMNNQELMNNQMIMNNNMNFNNNGNNVNFNNMNNQMININNMNNLMINNNKNMGMNQLINNMGMNMGNNIMNNQMMNNMGNNNMNNQMGMNINMNNQMGMNNGNLIPQSIQNNPVKMKQINEMLNLVKEENNVEEYNMNDNMQQQQNQITNIQQNITTEQPNKIPDDGSRNVSNKEQSNISSHQNQSYELQQQDLNNYAEYLFGLKCLGKKPQEISECCAKVYCPSCC